MRALGATTVKRPDSDPDLERQALALALLDGALPAWLQERLFAAPAHRLMLAAMRTLNGHGVDSVSLRAALVDAEQLRAVGGDEAILALTNYIPIAPESIRERLEELADRRRQADLRLRATQALGRSDDAAAREAIDQLVTTKSTDVHYRTLREVAGTTWLGIAPDPREWLLSRAGKGTLGRGLVGMLVAPGGRGKTMALVQLAISVATGLPWLGALTIDRPGRVLLLLAEEDTDEVRRRLYWCARELKLDDEQANLALDRVVALGLAGRDVSIVTSDPSTRTVTLTETHAKLSHEVASHDYAAVLLDPLARIAPTCEADNAVATRTVEALEAIAGAPSHPAVIVAHHTPKWSRREGNSGDEGAAAARGVTALTDAARWVCHLAGKSEDDLELKVTKSNGAPIAEPIALRRGESGVMHERERDESPSSFGVAPEARRLADARVLVVALRASGGVVGQDALRALAPGGSARQRAAVGQAIASGWIEGGGRSKPYTATASAPLTIADPKRSTREHDEEFGA